MRWDIGKEERRRIRRVELVNLKLEVLGVTKAARPTTQQANGYVAGLQSGCRDLMVGVGTNA